MKDISVRWGLGWRRGTADSRGGNRGSDFDHRDFRDNPLRPGREVRLTAVTGAALVYLVGDFYRRLILIYVRCVQHGARLDCRAASE